MATRTELPRRIYNPVQRDAVTFLETSAESRGERSLGELDVAPGGGVLPHRHLTYSERFEVLEGRLTVEVDGRVHVLGPGESALAPAGSAHRWSNAGPERAVARIELRPGHEGFERTLRVGYGLAADGRVTARGLPRNLLHLALLLHWSDIALTGPGRLFGPVVGLLVALARRRGVEADLLHSYC